MTRGSIVLAKGARIGALFKLDAHSIQCNSVSRKLDKAVWKKNIGILMEVKLPIDKTMLWHHILSHI